jgi:hypothetical protein
VQEIARLGKSSYQAIPQALDFIFVTNVKNGALAQPA